VETYEFSENYGIICDVGGKGKGNQDSLFFTEFSLIIAPGSPDSKQFSYKGMLTIVCDGVSGSNRGELGSTYAIRQLANKIMQHLYLESVEITQLHVKIQEFIEETNFGLRNEFQEEIQAGKIPKTTLVGTLVIGQWLWVFNLGDSRAFLIKDDHINQISKDHIGLGTAHEITEALGQSEIQPYVKVYNWAFENNQDQQNQAYSKNYFMILCSDGLTDKVSPDEIKNIIISPNPPLTLQERVMKLYNLSMDRDIDDNISIVVVDLAEFFKQLSPIQLIKLAYIDTGGI